MDRRKEKHSPGTLSEHNDSCCSSLQLPDTQNRTTYIERRTTMENKLTALYEHELYWGDEHLRSQAERLEEFAGKYGLTNLKHYAEDDDA